MTLTSGGKISVIFWRIKSPNFVQFKLYQGKCCIGYAVASCRREKILKAYTTMFLEHGRYIIIWSFNFVSRQLLFWKHCTLQC